MGEAPDFFEPDSEDVKPITHTRILWLMALVAVALSVVGIVVKSTGFGLGVLLGGILSFLNYYWLKLSLQKAFEGAVEGVKPKVFGAHYILRYLAFGLVLALVYLTKTVSTVAVILGLSSFAFAVVIEGILRMVSSIGNR